MHALRWTSMYIDELQSLANKRNIPLIEDAAHAIGATYKKKPLVVLAISQCLVFKQ